MCELLVNNVDVYFDDENKHCIRVKAKDRNLARRLRRSTANAKDFSHKLLETFSRAYGTEKFMGVTPTSDYMLGNKVSEFGLWFGFTPTKQTLQKVKLIAEKMVRPDDSIVAVEKRKHRIVLITKG